jgi:hypothetical protein
MRCISLMTLILGWPIWAIAQTFPATTSRAAVRGLGECVPAEALMIFWGRPPASGAGDYVVNRVLRWVELARELNLIPKEYRVLTDLAGSLTTFGHHDHAIILMDVGSKPVGHEGYRLARMQLAVVVATDGRNDEIVDRIRLLLSTYTDKQFGQIKVNQRSEARSYELTDSRLPGWATWEWGQLGRFYVIGLGTGAFKRILDSYLDPGRSIECDPWYRGARQKCQGRGAMIEWFVNYQGIRQCLEPDVKGRTEKVLDALGAGKLRRGLCTFRLEDRYLVCYVMNQFEDRDQFIPLSDPRNLPAELMRIVPPDASCAVMEVNLADWIGRLCNAYLASKSDVEQKEWRKWWADFERKRGVDTRTQFLDRLGKHLIVHTWPAHPLRLPLTFTLLLEIDDPVPVRDFIDAMMGEWQALLRQPVATSAATTQRTRDRFLLTIGREPDGMWYLQAGLVRPAVAVGERHIVISWSPEAVRANLEMLSRLQKTSASVSATAPK